MKLMDIMSDVGSDKKYRFHLAKTEPKGGRPIDALAMSGDEVAEVLCIPSGQFDTQAGYKID